MKITAIASRAALSAALLCISTSSYASFVETFDATSLPSGWVTQNLSTRNASGNPWTVGAGITDDSGSIVVGPQSGAGFAITNYTSVGSGSGTISNWLISPLINGLQNGDKFSFFTTTVPGSEFPDRLEFRLSTAGASTNVGTSTTSIGDFSTMLTTVNSSLAVGGYPEDWTQVTVTVSGLVAPLDGRVAFRYFVTSGGPNGANSNIIGVDTFSYISAVPEPTTLSMLAAGMGLVAMASRRRRKSNAAA